MGSNGFLYLQRSGLAFALSLCLAVELLADGSGAAAEVHLTILDPLREIFEDTDLAAAAQRDTIRLVGPRNGVCSAQVVATGEALGEVRARVSDLRSQDHAGRAIPADAVRVRYARKRVLARELSHYGIGHPGAGFAARFSSSPYYDDLHDVPEAGATLLPIWLTVRIPADAAPGRYTGSLTVAGSAVPVELTVSAWRCPDPGDWVTHVGLNHSPEALALQYKVPMWSDEHFDLLAQTMRTMGELGNKDALITVLHETHLGNEGAMVRFRATGDGSYAPDFAVMDRYLDLYEKHVGTPASLIVYLWDPQVVSRRVRYMGTNVTGLTAEGQQVKLKVTQYGKPGSEAVWKPLLDGIRSRVRARGWPEDVILLGYALDQTPRVGTVEFFKRIAPYARWAMWSHGRAHPLPENGRLVIAGMEVGRYDMPWLPRVQFKPVVDGDGILGGWDLDLVQASSCRDILLEYTPPSQWRSLADGTTGSANGELRSDQYAASHSFSSAGFAHVGLDFWEVDGRVLLLGRSGLNEGWDGLYRNNCPRSLLAPGPDGPVGTVRLEMLREGLQECQARVFIEKALRSGKLPPELADRCVALLKERLLVRVKNGAFEQYGYRKDPNDYQHRLWGVADDWQGLTARLFDVAADVAAQAGATP